MVAHRQMVLVRRVAVVGRLARRRSRDELDAGLFEGALDGGKIVGVRDHASCFKLADGDFAQIRAGGQGGLRPVD